MGCGGRKLWDIGAGWRGEGMRGKVVALLSLQAAARLFFLFKLLASAGLAVSSVFRCVLAASTSLYRRVPIITRHIRFRLCWKLPI